MHFVRRESAAITNGYRKPQKSNMITRLPVKAIVKCLNLKLDYGSIAV